MRDRHAFRIALRVVVVAVAAAAVTDCRAGGGRHAHAAAAPAGEVVTFPGAQRTLHGVVHRPPGTGPFPAVLYNHGSAPGMEPVEAANALGPVFAAHGWLFFMPFRRGQALSADAGPYIMDEIHAARARD